MLAALLGTTNIQDELATLVLDKAEGIPFFLEELVHALQETGAIALHDAISVGVQIVCYGAASRYLGMLATTMVRWEDAERRTSEGLTRQGRPRGYGKAPFSGKVLRAFIAALLVKQPFRN